MSSPGLVSLGTYLRRLTLGTLMPLIVFSALATLALVEQQRDTLQRGAQARVLALSTAVDAELRNSIGALRTLATAASLEAGNLQSFHQRASRVAAEHPEWLTLTLLQPSGQQLLNTRRPFGEPLPVSPDPASVAEVVRTRAPAIGRLTRGVLIDQFAFPIRVPVLSADGEVRYVLSAAVNPASVKRLLDAQRFPPQWVATVLDADRKIVARTKAFETMLGQPASQSLQAALNNTAEGWFRGATLEETQVYTPFIRSASTGFAVALGIPATEVDSAAWQALVITAGGAIAALLAAFIVAWWLGRSIAAPVEALAAQARALAAGVPGATLTPTRLREMAELETVFQQAGQAVRERERTQHQLAAVTGNATVGLFMLDTAGRCTFMNPAAEAMTGYGASEMAGRALQDLVYRNGSGNTDAPLVRALLDIEQQHRDEDVFVHRSGSPYPVAISASPIRADGIVVGTIVEVRDISHEKHAEAERQDMLIREQHAREEAESANRAKDEFLAMLGHELRNPLAAITTASHVLQIATTEETAAEAQAVIKRQARHLASLVNDLLDAGRVASGKIELKRAPVELAGLVRRVASTLGPGGRPAEHQLALLLQPAWVAGDATRLEQVLSNLLVNAIRYTPPGGHITVSVQAEAADVLLTVEDDGAGIPPELLPRIFALFVQGDRGIERSQGGLGIGLTLVRRLVELHGGTVSAASEGVDRGSRFDVRLPRIEPPSRAEEPAALPTQKPAPPRRVLIIEDNDDARGMLGRALRSAGHEVHERTDGPGGAEAAIQLHPDVAIIDIGLPGSNGYEVARRIRRNGAGQAMVLVALTGYNQPDDQQKSFEAGFDVHAAKPIDPQALLKLVCDGKRRIV
jgi:PAS domain S-box-containing protein